MWICIFTSYTVRRSFLNNVINLSPNQNLKPNNKPATHIISLPILILKLQVSIIFRSSCHRSYLHWSFLGRAMDLGSPRLFSHPPATTRLTTDVLVVIDDIHALNYRDAADKVRGLLQLDGYSDEDKLKLWEARLTLLMFYLMNQARQEAVALNNHLFLLENDAPQAAVYPLPRNNPMIPLLLLVLLLRLKLKPLVTVINEIYKLVYQTRLKSTSGGGTRRQLMVALYEVLAALVASHQWLVVLNMATLTLEQAQNHAGYGDYASNLRLVTMIITALVGGDTSSDDYQRLEKTTTDLWGYVMQRTGEYNGTFADIAAIASLAATVAPVLERLLAVWTLVTLGEIGVDDLDQLPLKHVNADVDGLVEAVTAHWPRNLTHYYGH